MLTPNSPATHPAILLEPGAGRTVPTPRALEAPRGGGLGAPRAEAAHASTIIIAIAYSTAPKGPGTESVILRAVEATAKHGGVNFGGTGGGNGGVEPGRYPPLLGGDGSGTNGTADRWRRSTAKAAVGCVAIGAIAIGHAVLGWCSAGNGPGLFLGVRRNDTPQSVIRDELRGEVGGWARGERDERRRSEVWSTEEKEVLGWWVGSWGSGWQDCRVVGRWSGVGGVAFAHIRRARGKRR